MTSAASEYGAAPGRAVVVVGGGVAATAAAMSASRAGAAVALLDGGTGASTLSTGAIDLVPWREGAEAGADLSAEARDTLRALGGYRVDEGGTRIVTTAGTLRPAGGRDEALLNVAPAAGQRFAVVRCDRSGWDADALALAWGSSFETLDAAILRRAGEATVADAEFAALHDDAERLGWLAERLREAMGAAGGRWTGIVLPPMLGVEHARARELSERVGLRCGEAAALPGGPAGLRFENARDRALAACGARRLRARVRSVRRAGAVWRVVGEDGSVFEAAAVVLAIGGLVGGGLEYRPAEAAFATALPPEARRPLRVTIDVAVTLGAHGRPLEVARSLFGPSPESIARPFARDPLLERAGILVNAEGSAAPESGLFAAGDLIADAPRAWLAALDSGLRAGAAAARHLGRLHVTESARPSLPREPASRP